MLFRDKVLNVQCQNFTNMENQWFDQNFESDHSNPLMSVRTVFSYNKDMKRFFAEKTFGILEGLGYKEFEKSVKDKLYEYAAVLGVLMNGAVFAFVPDAQADKRFCLYTLSVGFLENLFVSNKFAPDAFGQKFFQTDVYPDIEKRMKQALVNCIKKAGSAEQGFTNFEIPAYRLDCQVVGVGNGRFDIRYKKPVLKTKDLSLEGTPMVHVRSLQAAYQCLMERLASGVYELAFGDKVRVVTRNRQALLYFYNETFVDLTLRLPMDVMAGQFYAPSLGASEYSLGVTNIRLQELDRARKLQRISEVDLSDVNVNLIELPLWVGKTLEKASVRDLSELVVQLGLQEVVTVGEDDPAYRDAVILAVQQIPSHELWKKIKAARVCLNPFEFLSNARPKLYDKFEPVKVPYSVPELQQLFETGVFRCVTRKRDGSFSTHVLSNNPDMLESVYGSGYYARFESEGVRLRAVRRDAKNEKSFAAACKKYGIDCTDKAPGQGYEDYLNARLDKIQENTTVVKQSTLVTVRNCECYDKSQENRYYVNVDPLSVVQIVRLK